jgi:hypothetical protein
VQEENRLSTIVLSPVKNLNLSSNVANDNWQILGECKLSLEASMDIEIQAWLREMLRSLSLSTDFLKRVLKSAQDSATHAFQAGMKFEHIHLRIFVSQDDASSERTWGFFRIEKVGTPAANANLYDHSIEFYLYPEG